MNKRVYLIHSEETGAHMSGVRKFLDELNKQLQDFCPVIVVKDINAAMYEENVQPYDIIVLFNGDAASENIKGFINKANEKGVAFYPIAMDIKHRKPQFDFLKSTEGFDVEGRLKSRGLSLEYINIAADDFSRLIISKVFPSIYNNQTNVFISYRSEDGEKIATTIFKELSKNDYGIKPFRDFSKIKAGDNAEREIDNALLANDVLLFLQTPLASDSIWIEREIRFALIHHIPVLWIQIDQADGAKLLVQPADTPLLAYHSTDFDDSKKLKEIINKISDNVFSLQMAHFSRLFSVRGRINQLSQNYTKAGLTLTQPEKHNLLCYKITAPRLGYQYPQRCITQYVFPFQRTIQKGTDIAAVKKEIEINKEAFDSCILLTDRILDKKIIDSSYVEDTYNNYFCNWDQYLKAHGKMNHPAEDEIPNKDEIIISGAFPDIDGQYKQCIVDAVITFASAILRHGFHLTFGSHPTFQELFIDIATEMYSEDHKRFLHMYLSKYFKENGYRNRFNHFNSEADVHEIEAEDDREKSLTCMRKAMIQRKEVKAIICIGGKKKASHKEEGVREEIMLAQERGIPVFVVGSVGGCSADIALEAKNNWEPFNQAGNSLNEQLKTSGDYENMAESVLNYLEHGSN